MVPNGRAMVQTLQPTQVDSFTTLAPVALFTVIASTGASVQAPGFVALGAGVGHFLAGVMEVKDLDARFGRRKVAWFSNEQAISHCRQPVHLSGLICKVFLHGGLLGSRQVMHRRSYEPANIGIVGRKTRQGNQGKP